MNRIPNPVNLVGQFIIIILTNFGGKSGAKNHGSREGEEGNPEYEDSPLIIVEGDRGAPKSCGDERKEFFDNQ